MSRCIPILVFCLFINVASGAEPVAKSKLDGTWVFDSVNPGGFSELNRVWMSIVVIEGDSFTISNIMRNPAPLKGKFILDKANPKHVDIANEELDFSYFGGPFKWSASKRKALFELVDENRIRLAFPLSAASPRPTDFKASPEVHVIELCRAPKGFKEFPKEITVTVVNADGKPVEGAIVAASMSQRLDAKQKESEVAWKYGGQQKTAADGTAKTSMWEPPWVVRHEKTKEMGLLKATPATLAGGSVRVVLAPECRIVSSIVSEAMAKAGVPVGWTHASITSHGLHSISYSHPNGKFEFSVPPGKYTIEAYGENLHRRSIEVTIPPGQSEYELKPLELKASAMALMKGKPAPEFVGVVGWTGKPMKLADLKGQYVLIDFWGYWCGPCVAAMPVLIELHEKFHDKGLTVIGVHIDVDGDVDTVAKYDEMNSGYVKTLWKGKKLPFNNALVSGKREGEGEDRMRGGTAKLYGVLAYPTTVLIDREGKVVGTFNARNSKEAIAQVEKLLAEKK